MLRKALFSCFVLSVLIVALGVQPAVAQDSGIVCDDATIMLFTIAEIHGYSSNETTIFAPVDLSVYDFGENAPIIDLMVAALSDPEMEPLTDDIVVEQLLPAIETIIPLTEGLTETETKDIVDEDPACRVLRDSVIDYISAILVYETLMVE